MKTFILAFILFYSLTYKTVSQWVQTQGTPQGSGITGMAVYGGAYIFVTTGSVSGGQSGGVRYSTDGGNTWINSVDCFIGRTIINRFDGNAVFAVLWYYPNINEGIYVGNGATWYPKFNFATTGNNIFCLLNPNDTVIYAGTRTGILRSTNNGTNFAFSNNGIPANSWVWCLASDSNNVIAAGTSNGLFISTNQGDSWYQSTGLPAGDTVTSVCFYRANTDNGFTEKLIAGTDDGKILTSSSNAGYAGLVVSFLLGTNVKVESVSKAYISIEENYHFYIAAGSKNPQQPGGGVYKSTNDGQTFTVLNNGLPQNPVVSKIVYDPNDTNIRVYTGLFNNQNNGAQVYTQDFMIGIHQISNEVPKGFKLEQNYPNPFNPKSKIKMQIVKLSAVKLVVFDALGREVETLVNENLKAGTYEVDFDGSKLSSGVYYYKLVSDGFVETRKMVLVK